jgi:hypothetical protein
MRRSLSLVLASAFSLSLAATISVARADVKIVSKVSTNGGTGFGGGGFRRDRDQGEAGQVQQAPQAVTPSPGQTYTTYFKGRKARRESADGTLVVIYDREADKIHTLDPKAKTYYSTDYKSVLGETPTPANSPIRQETKLSLKEAAAGAGTTIGGVAAREFTVDGSQTMTMNRGGFAGRRGGNTQRGNAQGGVNGQGAERQSSFGGFGGVSTAITGSISMASPAVVLTPEIAGASYDRTLLLPLLDQLQPLGNQIFQPLISTIARQQSVPLAAEITLQRTIQMIPPADNTGANTPAARPTLPATTVTMEVQSIDKTAALDNALFTVPADFTMVEVPRQRGWMQRGGQGGQDGQRGGGRQGRQRNRDGARSGGPANQNPAAL